MAGEIRHRRAPAVSGEVGAPAAKAGGEEAEQRGRKDALGWLEWGRGWLGIVGEFLFQRIAASHLANPLELPPLEGVSVVVTGATSGIGLEIARSLCLSLSVVFLYFFPLFLFLSL